MSARRRALPMIDARFLRSKVSHLVALGFGAGLSPYAPGTVGTLWSWAAYAVLDVALAPLVLGWLIAIALPLGVWACARTAEDLGVADHGAIVWDEIVAFWIVLWVLGDAGVGLQAVAFALFRAFDALKPGPIGVLDRSVHGGLGVMLDDLAAAFATLFAIAVGSALW